MSKTPVKPTPKKPVGKEAPKAAAPRVWKAEDYVSSHASLEVVKETKSAFDIFDIDGSGLIDVNELITAFCSLGFDLANKISLTQLNNLLENNPDGLDFGHFLNLSTQRLGDSYSRAEINKIFSAFDTSRAVLKGLYRVTSQFKNSRLWLKNSASTSLTKKLKRFS